jgi:hypothetical protein
MTLPPSSTAIRVADLVPVDPALLTFGIDVFQAVMTGAMPVTDYDGDDLPCLGMNAISRQVGGHGLSPQEEASLVLRVVAFGELLGQAEHDTRIAGHVAPASAGGYQITTAFLKAAAAADIVQCPDGGFAYDLESVAARLVH